MIKTDVLHSCVGTSPTLQIKRFDAPPFAKTYDARSQSSFMLDRSEEPKVFVIR
jgi:hypothetical protein